MEDRSTRTYSDSCDNEMLVQGKESGPFNVPSADGLLAEIENSAGREVALEMRKNIQNWADDLGQNNAEVSKMEWQNGRSFSIKW